MSVWITLLSLLNGKKDCMLSLVKTSVDKEETVEKKTFHPIAELTVTFTRMPAIAESDAKREVMVFGSKLERIIENNDNYASLDEMIVDIFDVFEEHELKGIALNIKRDVINADEHDNQE